MSKLDDAIKAIEGLTEDQLSAIKGAYQSDLDDASAGIRKKETGKFEKAQAQWMAEKTTFENSIEELNAKTGDGSEMAEVNRQLERVTKRLDDEQKRNEQLAKDKAKADRESAFSGIVGQFQFADDSARDAGEAVLRGLVSDIDDLSNADDLKPVIDSFRDRQKRLLAAEPNNGAGTPPHDGSGNNTNNKKIDTATLAKPGALKGLDPKERREKLDAAWAQADD